MKRLAFIATSSWFAAFALLALAARPAAADLIVSADPLTIPVRPGSSGNFFDVTLTNSGGPIVDIGGFSFGVSTDSSLITFTGVSTDTTSPYIFAGHSLFGPSIGTWPVPSPVPDPSIMASDLYDTSFAGIVLDPGKTVGLGRVFFDVSSSALLGSQILFTFAGYPDTSVAPPNGIDLNFEVGNQPHAQVVPEPATATAVCSLLGMLGLAAGWKRRKRDGRA